MRIRDNKTHALHVCIQIKFVHNTQFFKNLFYALWRNSLKLLRKQIILLLKWPVAELCTVFNSEVIQ